MKSRTGDFNLGYFDLFKAPMYEAMTRLNPCETMNGTTPHYGPLLYTIGRVIGAHYALEIGVAEGWCSGFMSYAIMENNERFKLNGRFYGLDILNRDFIQKAHDEAGLPSTFIEHPRGSVDWLKTQNVIAPGSLDLIFVDGWHNNAYVLEELELLYPLLKDNGRGYIAFHDIYAFLEGAWPKIVGREAPDCKGVMRPAWEAVRFLENYGFALLRKMEGYDYSKQFWPDGDQPPGIGFDPEKAKTL